MPIYAPHGETRRPHGRERSKRWQRKPRQPSRTRRRRARPSRARRTTRPSKALYEQALAESRKWEGRSKANKKELDELKSQPAKDRTVEERLAALEAENETLKASAARSALVDSVAKATGLDRGIVSALNGADKDALTEQAQAIAAQLKPAGGAPKVPEAGKKQV